MRGYIWGFFIFSVSFYGLSFWKACKILNFWKALAIFITLLTLFDAFFSDHCWFTECSKSTDLKLTVNAYHFLNALSLSFLPLIFATLFKSRHFLTCSLHTSTARCLFQVLICFYDLISFISRVCLDEEEEEVWLLLVWLRRIDRRDIPNWRLWAEVTLLRIS